MTQLLSVQSIMHHSCRSTMHVKAARRGLSSDHENKFINQQGHKTRSRFGVFYLPGSAKLSRIGLRNALLCNVSQGTDVGLRLAGFSGNREQKSACRFVCRGKIYRNRDEVCERVCDTAICQSQLFPCITSAVCLKTVITRPSRMSVSRELWSLKSNEGKQNQTKYKVRDSSWRQISDTSKTLSGKTVSLLRTLQQRLIDRASCLYMILFTM